LIRMRNQGASEETGNNAVAREVVEIKQDEEDDDDVFYKPKNDILDQIEAEKAEQAVKEDSSDDDGPQLI